ncbi:MAG: hypothetical protein ACRC67_01930 [Inquilinus sp.]|uniref:hypothetical protein n=1 Tax=Inquilinus sp. TaxID=1932117 RepID=UPI003F34C884
MALIGSGVLAIWNGIAARAEDDFVAWHVHEHIPERVGLPGFLRGRRYVAVDGHPKYFNFYEAETPADFASPAYQARLNAPTDWTKRVVSDFIDTSRTVCEVVWSGGLGEGGWIETIVLETSLESEEFSSGLSAVRAAADGRPGIVGIHLLAGEAGARQIDTAEKRLRGSPDRVAAWILLVEGCQPDPLLEFRAQGGSNNVLSELGAVVAARGVYQLQFALTKSELDRNRSM